MTILLFVFYVSIMMIIYSWFLIFVDLFDFDWRSTLWRRCDQDRLETAGHLPAGVFYDVLQDLLFPNLVLDWPNSSLAALQHQNEMIIILIHRNISDLYFVREQKCKLSLSHDVSD